MVRRGALDNQLLDRCRAARHHQANVDSQLQTGTGAAKRLLGAPTDDARLLGLDGQWAYNAIKQVGNYSDIFQRNLGQGSPWKFPRGVNALWRNGGVLYPLPLR